MGIEKQFWRIFEKLICAAVDRGGKTPAEACRRDSALLTKAQNKVTDGGKARFHGDFRNAFFRGCQQKIRVFQAPAQNVIRKTDAHGSCKQPGKSGISHAAMFRHFQKTYV